MCVYVYNEYKHTWIYVPTYVCIVYVSSVLQDKMFQFWFNTFFVPWHMQYQAEEEKRAAVEVWMGNTLDKGNIQACTMGKPFLLCK